MKRLQLILDAENVKFNNKILADLIMRFAPDWRRVINECQRYSMGGQLDSIAIDSTDSEVDQLFASLKAKDFKKMRSWVVNNVDVDTSTIFRSLYDKMYDRVDPSSIPQLVLILADYQYKAAFVADHELNIVACMTEVMANVEMI